MKKKWSGFIVISTLCLATMDSHFPQFEADASDFSIANHTKQQSNSMDHDRLPVLLLTPESLSQPSMATQGMLSAKRQKKMLSGAHMRRKKWTEEEEETLITKYAEFFRSSVFSKFKTREKKFQPIADHVNSLYNLRDPIAFPWQWNWRDISIKIQNMRHQYVGVKQKIRRLVDPSAGELEEFDWEEGVNVWPNFLKYKDVFGDVELDINEFSGSMYGIGNRKALAAQTRPWIGARGRLAPRDSLIIGEMGDGITEREVRATASGGLVVGEGTESGFGSGSMEAGSDVLALGMDLDYDGVDEEDGIADTGDEDLDKENGDASAHLCGKKRKKLNSFVLGESHILSFLSAQFAELRAREACREERERLREKEKEERARLREEGAKERENYREKMLQQREERERIREEERQKREWAREEAEKEYKKREQERWEEEMQRRREWEEKREKEKMEWRERMLRLQYEHQAVVMQIQAQIAQGQQNLVSLLLGFLMQMAGSGNDLLGQVGTVNPFISQVLQNLQQSQDAMPQSEDKRNGGGNSNHQFLVDE